MKRNNTSIYIKIEVDRERERVSVRKIETAKRKGGRLYRKEFYFFSNNNFVL